MTRDDWPKGAWDDEPDFAEWRDPTTGLACAIVRNDMFGNLCGYVRLADDHPLNGIDTREIVPDAFVHDMQGVMHQPIGKRGMLEVFVAAMTDNRTVGMLFDVHGSLTFCGTDHPHLSTGFWYGFDCAHAFDFQPGMFALRGDIRKFMPPGMADALAELQGRAHDATRDSGNPYRETYRDWAYVQAECRSLAAQLASLHAVFNLMTVEAQHAARSAIERAAATAHQGDQGDQGAGA